jgi:hypothetical protein
MEERAGRAADGAGSGESDDKKGPLSGWLTSADVAVYSVTMCLTIDRPSPVPPQLARPAFVDAVEPLEDCAPGVRAGSEPVSATVMTVNLRSVRTEIRTSPPGWLYLMAFSTRL